MSVAEPPGNEGQPLSVDFESSFDPPVEFVPDFEDPEEVDTDRADMRVGLIGLGRWGRVWARVLRDAGVLAWGADPNPEARGMALEGDPDMETFAEVPTWDLGSVNGVVVATPPDTHREIVVDLLGRNIPVLVEKPMATSLDDAVAMSDAAEDASTRLVVDHTFLYNRSVNVARRWVEDRIGPVRYSAFRWTNVTTSRDEGALWNLGPHPFSILGALRAWSRPAHFEAVGMETRRAGVFDVAEVFVHHRDGSVDRVSVSNFGPTKDREFVVVGTEGSVVCRPTMYEVDFVAADGTRERVQDRGVEPLRACLERFLSAEPLHDECGADGVSVVSMIERAAARMGAVGAV